MDHTVVHFEIPANNVEKCGNVLAVADTREEADAASRRALGMFEVRLRPLVKATTDYLLGEIGRECFEGLPARLGAEIQALPAFRGDPASWEPAAPVAIETLPGWDQLDAKDWHGIGFAESVRHACLLGRGTLLTGRGTGVFQLSGLFWRALVRGGRQGAVYVLDSIRESRRLCALKEFLART